MRIKEGGGSGRLSPAFGPQPAAVSPESSAVDKQGLLGPQSLPRTDMSAKVDTAKTSTGKVGYLHDPKNAPKIIGASAVSVVASYMLGHQIKSNIDTTEQLNEYSARINAQEQEATTRALADSARTLERAPSTSPVSDHATSSQPGLLRIQKRKQGEQTTAVTKRGTPSPAGLFVAGVLGIAFARGSFAIEQQRARDRAIVMREQEYINRDRAAETSSADDPKMKKPTSMIERQ